ncbi:pilus assembly protein PilM [Shewanella marina]|uniref:pilus assembly protein PilM n=1 Tax=Shewanella marina TaxID=487319 RepID=UPI0004716430|nr:pilus assembly protein PilM [Shewanella marina]
MLSKLWKRQAPHMVGIDIGSHEVKAILLNKTSRGYKIVASAAVPLKKGAVKDHDIRDLDAVVLALAKVKQSLPKSVKYVAVAVSGSAVMTKVIFMDAALKEDEMEMQIEIEADNIIPYSLDDVSIDFEILGTNIANPSKVDVLLSACRTENIDARVDSIDGVDLSVKVVDIEGYALGRSYQLIAEQLPEINDNEVVAMIDIGAEMTTFAVIENGETTFIREQTFGSDYLTKAIVSHYFMSYEDAEKAKLEQTLPDTYELDVLIDYHKQLIQQIKRTLQIYCTSSGHLKVDFVVLSGGGAQMEGVTDLIRRELNLKVILADPFNSGLYADLSIKSKLQPKIGQYMVACGLALRSYSEWRI